MWPRSRGIMRSSASFVPRITPWMLMSTMRRAVRSSSSMKRPDLHDPGVVDQHVERAELLLGAVEERREGRAVGHVERQRDGARAELGGGLAGGIEVDVADRDPHALAQERFGRGAADPARGAGDRGGLSGEDAGLLGHAVSPSPGGSATALSTCKASAQARESAARVVGWAHAVLQVSRGSASPTPSTAAGPRPMTGERRARAHRPQRARDGASADPAARPAALPGDAPPAGRRPRCARQPRDHGRPARPRPLGPPARHVALLDGDLRPSRWSR